MLHTHVRTLSEGAGGRWTITQRREAYGSYVFCTCARTYGQFSCCQSGLGQWGWVHAWRTSEEVSHHPQRSLLKMHRENDYITHDALLKKQTVCWLGYWKINLPWWLTWQIQQMFRYCCIILESFENIPVCTCSVNPHKPLFFLHKCQVYPTALTHK